MHCDCQCFYHLPEIMTSLYFFVVHKKLLKKRKSSCVLCLFYFFLNIATPNFAPFFHNLTKFWKILSARTSSNLQSGRTSAENNLEFVCGVICLMPCGSYCPCSISQSYFPLLSSSHANKTDCDQHWFYNSNLLCHQILHVEIHCPHLPDAHTHCMLRKKEIPHEKTSGIV